MNFWLYRFECFLSIFNCRNLFVSIPEDRIILGKERIDLWREMRITFSNNLNLQSHFNLLALLIPRQLASNVNVTARSHTVKSIKGRVNLSGNTYRIITLCGKFGSIKVSRTSTASTLWMAFRQETRYVRSNTQPSWMERLIPTSCWVSNNGFFLQRKKNTFNVHRTCTGNAKYLLFELHGAL